MNSLSQEDYVVNAQNESPGIALDGKIYPPVGRCIYCGTTHDLTKEHILPFGLSGTAILPASSCRACASITGAIEQTLLRGDFWPVRIFRDLKSRTKHLDAPASWPVTAIRKGKKELFRLSVDELPLLLHLPIFTLPRCLFHTGHAGQFEGIQLKGLAGILYGKNPKSVAAALGADELQISAQPRPVEFARMIAKIGYAFAYAEGVIDELEEPAPFLPAILGHRDDIGKWVGTLNKPYEAHTGTLHRIELHRDSAMGLLVAEVQLFSDSETPSYCVILGKIKSEV